MIITTCRIWRTEYLVVLRYRGQHTSANNRYSSANHTCLGMVGGRMLSPISLPPHSFVCLLAQLVPMHLGGVRLILCLASGGNTLDK